MFEVHADIASTLTGNDLQLRFDTGSTVTFLEAEELDDGSTLSGIKYNKNGGSYTFINSATSADVIVSVVDSQPWTLVNQGNLFVSQSTTPLRSRQLLGGELGEPVLRLQFRAQHEAVDVTDIQLTASGSTTSNEVDRLELFKDGEAQPFALATIGGCGSDDVLTVNPGAAAAAVKTFCANMESRQLVVPEGEEVDILVRPRVKTDTQGAVSGQVVQFFMDNQNVADEATGSGAVRARGDESSNNLSANDEDTSGEGEVFIGTDSETTNGYIAGAKNIAVMSKIVSITNASDDPNGSAIPIGLSDIGKFKFTGANHTNSKNGNNASILSGIIFNVNATNVALNASAGNFRVYNAEDATNTSNCTVYRNDSNRLATTGTASGSLLVDCNGLYAASTVTDINPGASLTLVLQGNVTDQNSSSVGAPSTLQVSLQDFDSTSRYLYGIENRTYYSHIEWEDTDTSDTEFRWIEYPTTVVKSTSYAG